MRSLANTRFHAAIFTATDPTTTCSLLIGGTLADIEANVPAGGTWRVVPANVHRIGEVPPLGQLPTPVIPTEPPLPTTKA